MDWVKVSPPFAPYTLEMPAACMAEPRVREEASGSTRAPTLVMKANRASVMPASGVTKARVS